MTPVDRAALRLHLLRIYRCGQRGQFADAEREIAAVEELVGAALTDTQTVRVLEEGSPRVAIV